MNDKPGYHLSAINKGEIGEFSKIVEEFQELEDAIKQNNPILVLIELSDMMGAIEKYLDNHHSSIKLEDVILMARTTSRAFENGHRN